MLLKKILLITSFFFIFSCKAKTYNKAPEFRAVDIDGINVFVNSKTEKTVILTFWATYCEPCWDELILLNRIYKQYTNDIEVVAVSIDEENYQEIVEFRQVYNLQYTIIHDKNMKLRKLFNVETIPQLFIINNMDIIYTQKGRNANLEESILQAITISK